MIETILAVMTSGGFGAITGLIGGFLAKREQRKLLQLENEHARYMADIDLQRDQLQYQQELALADKRVEHAQIEGEIAADVASAQAFTISQQPSKLTKVGELAKTAMRPVITVVLLWVTWTIYSETSELIGGLEGLDAVQLQKLFVYIVHAIIFLTITAVSWWFASRGERAVKAIKGLMNG